VSADLAMMAKAVAFRETGIEVHFCGDEIGKNSSRSSQA